MADGTRGASVLRLGAVLDAALGVLLLSGTWDGLYDFLDLPHKGPPLLAQLGGGTLVAFAYLLWIASRTPGMTRAAARAAAAANALGAMVIAAWLVFRTNAQLDVGTQGAVELTVAAIVLAALAVAQLRIAREPDASRQVQASPKP